MPHESPAGVSGGVSARRGFGAGRCVTEFCRAGVRPGGIGISFKNIERLHGKQLSVSIPTDEAGYLGRECPREACLGFFKVRPGTGLTGENLPFYCPYCGNSGSSKEYFTEEQIAYVRSVAMRQASEALREDLKEFEFQQEPKGAFGIGISMKLKPSAPLPLHRIREPVLETHVTCTKCTLDYAVYGKFGYCPDCGGHNSVQILEANLGLVEKQLILAEQQDDAELRVHLIEDALENCVSAFDGFGRELLRVQASASCDAAACERVSFQNPDRAATRIHALFGVRLQDIVAPDDWKLVSLAFMRRHVIAHRSGVVDAKYLKETDDDPSLLGRRLMPSPRDIRSAASVLRELGTGLADAISAAGGN